MSKNHKIPILIKIPKNPKVKILKGSASKFKTGFIKELIIPKIKQQKKNIIKGPEKITPGINLIAKNNPKIATRI
ncbi:MAG: hypothetical protein AMJ89_00075 [candidate division Zixibacteria bacterium SM23_73]|nr:MAG: hypothetical protein AMJ89_00075 [candidate division Zixibacteria bacterium SM23_73]